MTLSKRLVKEVVKVLNSLKILKHENIEKTIEIPPNPELGDLASNICFSLSKKIKKAPKELADEIVSKIKIPKGSFIKKIESKGGYINFFLDNSRIAKLILKKILEKEKRYGSSNLGRHRRVMVEFSQPNTNKPMHIGHARNTALGDSLSRILSFSGYDVIKANYFGDIGLHVAKSILGYLKWGRNLKPKKKPDHFVGDFYTKYYEEVKNNPELEEEAREILRRWEKNDKRILALWKKMRKWCLEGFKETYKRFGVSFDVYFFESQFEKIGKEIAKKVLEKGIAFKTDDGAVVADLEKHGLPSCVILRSDGTSLYSTKDLALGIEKFEKYGIEKSIYVVGSEQKLYLKQIFKILELLGYKKAKDCYHLAYGLVMLPEGKMSSRKGTAVLLDNLLDELKELAYGIVSKNNPKMSEKEKNMIAESVGLAALKYALLKVSPEKNILFDKKEVIQFEGNTGPYLQYAHTRCSSILRKAGKHSVNLENDNLTEEENKLLMKLAEFPQTVESATKDLRPHYICSYAYDLATLFNEFYHKCPVIKAEPESLRDFRLTLVKAVEIVLKISLNLLGIKTLERM